MPRQDERLQQWRDSEERRRAKRQSKEAKEERKRSKTKFRGQSRQEALATARQEQPVLIETPKHKPLTLKAGEQVERFHGEFGAQIDGPGGPSVVDSALALRSDVGDGPKRLADYTLEDHGATLSPDNPIVATEIAKDVQGGLRIGEWGIQLETASSAAADVVEDRAFFANALPDIDYVVLPTATGAHLSLQVRSADAPEQAVLSLDLPAGAQARLVEDEQPPAGGSETGGGSSESGDLPPGSVEIVKEGTVIASIARPVAWGADNEPLEVSYSLRGRDLVLSFPHRSADVQYPLLVDPLAADRFRVNEQGQPVSNSSFLIARSGGEAAAWTYGESTPGFPHGPGQGSGAYDHNGFLWVSNLDRNRFWYPDGSYGQWTWQAPRMSFIKRADFNNVNFNPTFQDYPAAMCLAEAVFSVVTWNWESGYWDDARGFSGGPNSSPFIGGPAPNGSCNTQTNNGKAHTIYNPTPGNIAVFRFFSYGQGYKYNHSNAEMYGGAVYLDDNDVPSVTDATSSPGGWLHSGTLTTRVNSTDRGLGTIVHAIDIPIEGPNPTGRRVQFTGACDRGRISRCPERFDHTFSYNSEDVLPDDPAYPATLGPQRIREGINTIEGDTYDATYKPTHFGAGQIKIDRSGPDATIAGVNEGELLRDRDYNITATSTDRYSGSKTVILKLDGVEKARRDDCPATTSPCTLNWTLRGGDQTLGEGTHTLRVETADQLGNPGPASTRTFRVERTPPDVEADGTLRPPDRPWVPRGPQSLLVDAEDDSGIASASVEIDGRGVKDGAVNQDCASSGCSLAHDFLIDTDDVDIAEGAQPLADGSHSAELVVRDGAGNARRISWVIRQDRTPPGLELSGPLNAVRGQVLANRNTYRLDAIATDGAGSSAQSGLGSIDFAVDEGEPDGEAAQECPGGGCSLSRSFEYVAEGNTAGEHTVRVTATDRAGNTTTKAVTFSNAPDPAPTCATPPPAEVTTNLDPIGPTFALDLFQSGLPEAFARSSIFDLGRVFLQPALVSNAASTEFVGTDVLGDVRVDRSGADGVTLIVDGGENPVCFTPTNVASDASSPISPTNGVTAVFPNSASGTDTAVRPSATGVDSFLQLRSPLAPQQFSWHADLQPGLALRSLDDGGVAVVRPSNPDFGAPEMSDPPTEPTLEAQRAAIADTAKHVSEAERALARGQSSTADEVVAVIREPWAKDALNRAVATSLTATGSTVTMTVQHAPASAYPVIANLQVTAAESVNTATVAKAVTKTPQATDADEANFDEFATPGSGAQPPEPPPATGNPAPSTGAEPLAGDFPDVGSAADNDLGANAIVDPSSPRPADESTTVASSSRNGRLSRLELGLTESDPYSIVDDQGKAFNFAGKRKLRPFVYWNIMDLIAKYNAGRPLKDCERRAARNWIEYRKQARDAKDPKLSVMPTFDLRADPSGGCDYVALPTAYQYQDAIGKFLEAPEHGFIKTIEALNEPDLKRKPTSRNPVLAADYWALTTFLCSGLSNESAYDRCGPVPAGAFVGRADDSNGYKERYRARLERRWGYNPRIWSFHAWGDVRGFLLNRERTYATPRIIRYFRRLFAAKRYEVSSGKSPRVWITEVGADYRMSCKQLKAGDGPEAQEANRRLLCGESDGQDPSPVEPCPTRADPNKVCKRDRSLRMGLRRQRNAAAFLMRAIGNPVPVRPGFDFVDIERLYYYNLQDQLGFVFPPRETGAARPIYSGRCTMNRPVERCPSIDSGLVGATIPEDRQAVPQAREEDTQGRTIRNYSEPVPGFAQPDAVSPVYCAIKRKDARRDSQLPRPRPPCSP